MSNFLKQAAEAAKSVEAARKARARMESTAQAKFDKATEVFEAARQAHEDAGSEAVSVEAAAWRALMERLSVPADVAAQIVGVDAGHVKAVLSAADRFESSRSH